MSRPYNYHQTNGSNQENAIADTYNILNRTSASIQRSNQVAIETEQVGTAILSDLGEQRESLLRSTRRLEDTDDNLVNSRSIIKKLRREVLYNKVILIAIIIMEVLILAGILVIKFILH